MSCARNPHAVATANAVKNNAKKIHWPNPDPAVQKIPAKQQKILFRETRENIFIMLKKFFTDLDT